METGTRFRSTLVFLVVSVTMFSSVSASSSTGLFFLEGIEVDDADSGIRTIEIDADGNIFASFGSTLYKLSALGSILEERSFSTEISATSLSPDFTKLALTLRSGASGEDSVFLLSTEDLSTLVSNDVTRTNAHLLEWSSNGAKLYSNAPDAGILQLNRETLTQETSYVGNHSGEMACFDVSESSGSVLTADENGLIQLWNSAGDVLQQEILLQSIIHDCKIGDNDEYFSISTPDNGIRKWTFTGSELKPIDIDDAIHFELAPSPNVIIVHKDSPTQHILVYDYLNEQIIDQVEMFHNFDDYELVFDDADNIENIFTNSKVDYVVKYGTEVHRIGVGQSGIDTDGDEIPDSLDNDDDGDGIEDNWDLNCEDIGISCELLPDENYIRSIDVEINSTHIVVKQSFTLNKKHSTTIRDLSRYSMDTDIKLIEAEAQLFADSICGNMNEAQLANSISSTINFGNATLDFVNLYCSIEDGMVLYSASDGTSHIRYSVSVTYRFDSSQSLNGIVLQVQNNRFHSDGSMTELSEQHPLSIRVHGDEISTLEYVPWHIQEQQVSFTLSTKGGNSESLDPSSIISSPIVIAIGIIGIGGFLLVGIFLFKRQSERDSYDITLDEEEDEEEDEYLDEEYEDYDSVEEEEIEEEEISEPSKRRPPPRRRKKQTSSKRVPVQSKEVNQAQQLLQESSNEVVRKRRARRSDSTVKSKRRKLSDVQSVDSQPRKRRAVKRKSQSDDQMDETLKRFVSESPEE